jgi:uncharacterized repeat protein (TIGR02543 family)
VRSTTSFTTTGTETDGTTEDLTYEANWASSDYCDSHN